MFYKYLTISVLFFLSILNLTPQSFVIDRVVAIVGKNTVLLSDVENHVLQMTAQRIPVRANTRCQVFESLLEQNLMLNQAIIDSIIVSETDVDMEMNKRLQFFIRQIGSEQALEEYYDKSVLEIKEDLRNVIRDQLVTNEVQMTITGNINVTPSEVKSFFNNLPADSLPMVNSQVELRQIVKYPEYSELEKFEIKERLNQLRQRIIAGSDFSTMAILYSQDPGTARRGGELGFVSRADLVPEFANVAFSLRDNRVSHVFETEFGYHIVQLIERRGEQVNVRHILMVPAASAEAREKAVNQLDSIAQAIRTEDITFRLAAVKYTDDKNTRMSGGLKINPNTGSSRFELDELDPAEYIAIRNLQIGEISNTFETRDEKGKPVFKILYLVSQTKPQRANLRDNYNVIKEMALMDKRMRILGAWIKDKQQKTYIRILDNSFSSCEFKYPGWQK